jgi:hypothetical protein
MNKFLSLIFLWMLAGTVLGAAATDVLFQSAEAIDITLTGPFGEIDDERDKEPEYAGTAIYVDAGRLTVVLRDKSYTEFTRSNNRDLW